MKTLITIIIAASLTNLIGGQVKLAWDASPTPGVTNYTVCAGTNAITFDNALVRVSTGTNQTVSVSNLAPATWQFMVVAQKDGVVSDPSNVVVAEVPRPPATMRTVIPQWSGTVASTNWQDVGFFRVRIE